MSLQADVLSVWQHIHTFEFSFALFRHKFQENMKPVLSVFTKPLKYCRHAFSSKVRAGVGWGQLAV